MTKKDEHLRQVEFRNWASYLNELPPNNGDSVLDLGCGLGTVTNLLCQKYSYVIGIDNDPTIIDEANKLSPLANAAFIKADLRKISDLSLPKVDGIWCSFTAAYFPDFDKVFSHWIRLLKAGGWIALIEVNDLFNHSPLSKETRDIFADHYQKLFMEGKYDFMMGSKLKVYAENYQFEVIRELEVIDPELAFTGQATGKAVAAWQDRFNRMTGLRRRLGENRFIKVETDFLDCIRRDDHTCAAKINFIVAKSIS